MDSPSASYLWRRTTEVCGDGEECLPTHSDKADAPHHEAYFDHLQKEFGNLLSEARRHTGSSEIAEGASTAHPLAGKPYTGDLSGGCGQCSLPGTGHALVADKIVSAKAFAQAKEAYENARIAYEAVSRNNAASGTSITAPLGGYVKNLLVKEGDYVSVGQPLVSITQDQRLSLRADVPQRHYQALSSMESANFCTPYNKEVYELKALNGRLLSYGKSASENGNMIPVTFEFDNRGKVMPGSFVEVYLLGAAQADAIALPLTALTEEQGSYYIYKQVHPERYMKQLVSLGASDGTRVQILSGVSAGDKVVMRGAYQVKLANTSNAIPGHSHEH